MTQECRDWLPVSIAERDGVREPIERATAEWIEAWFPRASIRVSSYQASLREPQFDGDDGHWEGFGDAVSLRVSRRTSVWLLGRALDCKLDPVIWNETDRQLLQSFEQELLWDLIERIGHGIGLEKSPRSTPTPLARPYGALGGVLVGVSEIAKGPHLWLAIPLEALTGFCRASMPQPARRPARLHSLRSALGQSPVHIEAKLAEAKISLADLKHLAPGDVLILNSRIDVGAEIVVSGSQYALARGELTEHEGHKALALRA
jgi:hypothetical protein